MKATAMILAVLLFTASSCAPSENAKEPELASEQPFPIVTRVPSDPEGVDFIITYDPKVASQDYATKVSSSIPLTDTYAIEIG
jgi:hypothetical protein